MSLLQFAAEFSSTRKSVKNKQRLAYLSAIIASFFIESEQDSVTFAQSAFDLGLTKLKPLESANDKWVFYLEGNITFVPSYETSGPYTTLRTREAQLKNAVPTHDIKQLFSDIGQRAATNPREIRRTIATELRSGQRASEIPMQLCRVTDTIDTAKPHAFEDPFKAIRFALLEFFISEQMKLVLGQGQELSDGRIMNSKLARSINYDAHDKNIGRSTLAERLGNQIGGIIRGLSIPAIEACQGINPDNVPSYDLLLYAAIRFRHYDQLRARYQNLRAVTRNTKSWIRPPQEIWSLSAEGGCSVSMAVQLRDQIIAAAEQYELTNPDEPLSPEQLLTLALQKRKVIGQIATKNNGLFSQLSSHGAFKSEGLGDRNGSLKIWTDSTGELRCTVPAEDLLHISYNGLGPTLGCPATRVKCPELAQESREDLSATNTFASHIVTIYLHAAHRYGLFRTDRYMAEHSQPTASPAP